ncbi:MAG TPA: hypothetical protein VEC94_13180 [Pseudolabrys sp.]|nr:hypothetical protein [Pseudolabrys sp.]
MSNRDFRDLRKSIESRENEFARAHYAGAVVLILAAAAFLVFVFGLDRIYDFTRFVY